MTRGRITVLAAILGLGIVAAAGWYWFSRRALTPAQMAAAVPQSGSATAFVDVDQIRRAGILDLIAGSKAAEDLEYKEFVGGTGFDYRRDLRQVAGAFGGGDAHFLLSGDFNWTRIEAYAVAQGATCKDGFCRLKSPTSGRWISFNRLRGNAMALAFSGNQYAALDVALGKGSRFAMPDAPVWVAVSPGSVESAKLPAGTQSFLSPLASAETAVFSIRPKQGDLELALDVTCGSEATASDLLVRMEGATNMLRKLIERERLKPNPDDLSGLLTSGTFRRDDRRVYGSWPLRKAFVQSLAAGAVK